MAGRLQQLDSTEGGINRLKTKGGASKKNLYDMLNGYVDNDGVARSRPGTVQDTVLPAGTKGLAAFDGGFVVFSHQVTEIADARYSCEVLTHPTDDSQPLLEIHFAGPVLGSLYVVAEFVNGDVFHYWLQHQDTWAADTNHKLGDLVQPSVPNGFSYKATRIGAAPQSWAPDVARTVGDVVVPTTENGFDYTVTNTIGSDPKSGSTEPAWPESDGATVYEDTGYGTPGADGSSGSGQTLPPDVSDRYKPPPWWKFDSVDPNV